MQQYYYDTFLLGLLIVGNFNVMTSCDCWENEYKLFILNANVPKTNYHQPSFSSLKTSPGWSSCLNFIGLKKII